EGAIDGPAFPPQLAPQDLQPQPPVARAEPAEDGTRSRPAAAHPAPSGRAVGNHRPLPSVNAGRPPAGGSQCGGQPGAVNPPLTLEGLDEHVGRDAPVAHVQNAEGATPLPPAGPLPA